MHVVKENLNLSKYSTILKSKLRKVVKNSRPRLLLGDGRVEIHQRVEYEKTNTYLLCKRDYVLTGGIAKFLLTLGIFLRYIEHDGVGDDLTGTFDDVMVRYFECTSD